MLKIHIQNERQNLTDVATGVLEIGRGAKRDAPRFLVDDSTVARDQLRVEELPEGRIRLDNLSTSRSIVLNEGQAILAGSVQTLTLPVSLTVGKTQIKLSIPDSVPSEQAVHPASVPAGPALSQPGRIQEDIEQVEVPSYQTIDSRPIRPPHPTLSPTPGGEGRVRGPGLLKTNRQQDPETLAQWLETLVALKEITAGSEDFYRQTAKAMVELIDLELGMVLLRRNEVWTVAGAYAVNDRVSVHFSRTLVSRVASERRTFY